jgi:peptide/nickel transport system ATP-binding protein
VFEAVKDISFTIEQGCTLAIVGESGSGKSVTAMSLMGLLPAIANVNGDVSFSVDSKEYNLAQLDKQQWQGIRGNEIAMVFQEPMTALNPVMKIGEQLCECIEQHKQVGKQQAKQLAIEWLGKVKLPEPEKLYNRYPHQLSGGQKQRVTIAMALCNTPSLIMADEPTTALDVTVQQEIVKLMQQLQAEQGCAMIFITHDLALAADVADDILVMYKGEMVEYGKMKDVLHYPQHVYTKALLACRPSVEQKNTKLPVIADFLSDDPQALATHTWADTQTDTTLLDVKDLQVWFPEKKNLLGKTTEYYKAVKGVSFTLKQGEVLGLVGESGCGKSTISKSLLGLLPVESGQIIYKGKDLAAINASEWRQVRRDIQMIFQDPYASLNPRIRIGDSIVEVLRVHNIVPASEYKAEAERLLSLVQLPADAFSRYPHQFSGGQRQRIGIARALAVRPKLLVCDESVSALDVSVQAQVLNLLKELQSQLGLSYLFISHDLSVVHYISDRVMVMQAGELVEVGTANDVLQHPQNDYTRRLISAVPGAR